MILAVVGMESETEQPFLAAKIDFAADIQERHRYESAAGNDANRRALVQLDRAAVFQPPGSNLRSAQVLENRDHLGGARGRGPDARERFGVLLRTGVRKIQPADVDAGEDELLDHGFISAGGANRGHNLRVSHE